MKLKFVVRWPSSLHSCRNYLCTQCADFFQILVVASPGSYARTFFFFFIFFAFSLTQERIFQNANHPTNHSRNLSNFSWIFFSMVLAKLSFHYFFFIILKIEILTNFTRFHYHGTQWEWKLQPKVVNFLPNVLPKRTLRIFEIFSFVGNSSTYIGYLWPSSFQDHFGVIRCTCDFSENKISKLTTSTNHSRNLSTSLELSSQWSSQNCGWDFWNFENWKFKEFCSHRTLYEQKMSKRYSSYNSYPKVLNLFWIFLPMVLLSFWF